MMLDDPTKLNTTTDAAIPATPAITSTSNGLAASLTSSSTATPSLKAAPKPPGMNGLAAGLKPPAMTAPSLNDSVADKVHALTSQDSPLMQQAKTTALKTANRRGLLNSSMAVGAAQDATVRAALPIAAQDASQAFQKNMQASDQTWQSGEKALDRTQQTSIVDKQITSTEGLASAQRDLDLKMQANSISAAEQQQIRDITSREGIAAADRALQDLLQSRDIASREGMAKADRDLQSKLQSQSLNAQRDLAFNDRANQQLMQDREITYQTTMRGLDRSLQEQLASWNLKSSDRNAAAQFLTNMQSAYEDSYSSIMANTALDATTREAQLKSAKNLRDKNLNFVEQMYQVDLKWTDADFGTATPTASNATAPATPFNAAGYLAANPDVAAAVKAGKITAEQHYAQFGQKEGRRW